MFRSKWMILFGLCTFLGLLSFSTAYTEDRLDGESTPIFYPLIWEMTGAYSVFVLLPAILPLFRKFPVGSKNFHRTIPLHLLFSVLFGVSHTLLMTGSRSLIYAVFGLGTYKMGDPFFRFVMEYQKQFLIYFAILIGEHVISEYRRNRERERKTAELELQTEQFKARLAQAELHVLKGQIQPHFLFNTLNMISSMMYEDVAKADRLITRLSTLLRMSLEQSGKEKITLREELDFLELYLDLMKGRFEEKFHFLFSVSPETENALVPYLVLQPLIENSIKHNDAPEMRLEVRAWRDQQDLFLQVLDNGPGLPEGSPYEKGLGLSNTRDRLRHLYEDRAAIQLENRPDGGLSATIRIPWEYQPVMEAL